MSWLVVRLEAPKGALVMQVAHSPDHAQRKPTGKPGVHLE